MRRIVLGLLVVLVVLVFGCTGSSTATVVPAQSIPAPAQSGPVPPVAPSTVPLPVLEFVRFLLSERGQELISEAGYIPLSPRAYELLLARLENGTTGTLFGGANPQKGCVECVLEANK